MQSGESFLFDCKSMWSSPNEYASELPLAKYNNERSTPDKQQSILIKYCTKYCAHIVQILLVWVIISFADWAYAQTIPNNEDNIDNQKLPPKNVNFVQTNNIDEEELKSIERYLSRSWGVVRPLDFLTIIPSDSMQTDVVWQRQLLFAEWVKTIDIKTFESQWFLQTNKIKAHFAKYCTMVLNKELPKVFTVTEAIPKDIVDKRNVVVEIGYGMKCPRLENVVSDLAPATRQWRDTMSLEQKTRFQELYDAVYTKNYQDIVASLDAMFMFKKMNTSPNYTISILHNTKKYVLSKKTIWHESYLSLRYVDWWVRRLPTGQELEMVRSSYLIPHNTTTYTLMQPSVPMPLVSSQYVQEVTDEFSFDEWRDHGTLDNIKKPVAQLSDQSLLYLYHLLWDAMWENIYNDRQIVDTNTYRSTLTVWDALVQTWFRPVWLSETPTQPNKHTRVVGYWRQSGEKIMFFAIAACDVAVFDDAQSSETTEGGISFGYDAEQEYVWEAYQSKTFWSKHMRPGQVITFASPNQKVAPQEIIAWQNSTWVVDGKEGVLFYDADRWPSIYFAPHK